MRSAFRRARRAGSYLVSRFAIGAGALGLGTTLVFLLLRSFGFISGAVFDSELYFSVGDLIFTVAHTFAYAVTASLIAVTLSRAYLITEKHAATAGGRDTDSES